MLISTRGNFTATDTEAVLQGIAPDGGLFVIPELVTGMRFDTEGCMGVDYSQQAEKIMSFLLPSFAPKMADIVSVYQKKFTVPEITPLKPVGPDYALELYHGPTSAFKDVALSVLPLFVTEAMRMEKIHERVSILTATSGDTGKAALEGFKDVEGTDITVFFPENGVSQMQKTQMVTQEGKNVRVCAVRGNFDDCQRGVKEAFAAFSSAPVSGRRFSSANSINIGRLVPQVVYYFSAYSQLLAFGKIHFGELVDFVVPTGNFGDILAGYIARQMGLPVGKLVCASNANQVLTDFIHTGVYDRRRPFYRTDSPSMDILVSSNLERMLYYITEGDSLAVAGMMEKLNQEGVYRLEKTILSRFQEIYYAGSCNETRTSETIKRLWKENSYLSDTHTAVGFGVLEQYKASEEYCGNPCVVLSTASPFKFPAAVLKAIGGVPSENEFDTADSLSALTGRQIPENLFGLREKIVRHQDVVECGDLVRYALK